MINSLTIKKFLTACYKAGVRLDDWKRNAGSRLKIAYLIPWPLPPLGFQRVNTSVSYISSKLRSDGHSCWVFKFGSVLTSPCLIFSFIFAYFYLVLNQGFFHVSQFVMFSYLALWIAQTFCLCAPLSSLACPVSLWPPQHLCFPGPVFPFDPVSQSPLQWSCVTALG